MTEIVYCAALTPNLSKLVASLTNSNIKFVLEAKTSVNFHPYLKDTSKGSISGDRIIARYIARESCPELYFLSDPWLSSEVDQWLDQTSQLSTGVNADFLNKHLSYRTYIVGHSLSLADIGVYFYLKQIADVQSDSYPHLLRWSRLIKSLLPDVNLTAENKQIKPKTVKPVKPAATGKSGNNGTGKEKDQKISDEGGGCPPLENAIEGQVCTRFPPEPSGYLHIGHAKAVLLNQYYAEKYKGRLLVRFDDTNPSKEKEEFEDSIIKDLATLGVVADAVSHTSDHFEICQKLARGMISEGLAYMDDTPQDKMQAERMTFTPSARRDTSVEVNSQLFEALLKGEPEAQAYCLRAKIDMSSPNGTMRDPVLYRFNDTPHHRTGSQYKAYPTYDFACPIVDSIEGVTHALRTTEYNDRDEQYHWIQNALHLRHVYIMAFGKMNFIYTVLSKRKLNWFVENGIVNSWFDPRFPTIQGCVRRGMNVEVLKNFIIKQGASRRVITMEWDKFWAENKQYLEEIAPRYMAIEKSSAVSLKVTNLESDVPMICSVQKHPQKPELGNRVLRRGSVLWLEGEDCQTFKEGEEVTLLRWGNFFIDKIVKSETGDRVISMEGRFNAAATNFSKTKKATWLTDVPDVIVCQLVEFGHLIAKPKLLDTDNFQDFLNPVTKVEVEAYGDPCLRTVEAGEVIQLERKGFYRCDSTYGGPNRPIVLFAIPDGRVKTTSATTAGLLTK